MAESTALQLAERSLTLVIAGNDPAAAAQALLTLPADSRALALSAAFTTSLEGIRPREASDAAEHNGRRLEMVIDCLPETDSAQLIHDLIDAGDIELVLSMVRGNAAATSTAARYLNKELVAELFAKDPETHLVDRETNPARLLYLAWTLIVESDCAGAVEFFATEESYDIPISDGFVCTVTRETILYPLRILARRDGDEDAQAFLRILHDKVEEFENREAPDTDPDDPELAD